MSLDKFKKIINDEYFLVFKQMCAEEKEISRQGKNAKSMDDVIKLNKKLIEKYSYYQLYAIIELWKKVKAASSLDVIIGCLLKNHFQCINSYPSPTTYHLYEQYMGNANIACFKKSLEQSVITESLREKVESGILENYKKREMHKYAIPFEELSIGEMIPWKKEDSKTNSVGFDAGTTFSFVPVFFQPAPEEKSNNSTASEVKVKNQSKCVIL